LSKLEEAIAKAEILVDALEYVRKFRHKPIVVKLGGSVMEHAESLNAILEDIVFMETVGMQPIVVHGGGKDISEAMKKANLTPRFVQGRRYTDEDTLQIVCEVLVDRINADIVDRLERLGGWAIGVHHRSSPALFGEQLMLEENGQPIDLGRVGKITYVEGDKLNKLCHAGIIPVLPSLALDDFHELLNVNADTAACAVAGLMKAEKLVFVSDTPGILLDRHDPSTLQSSLTAARCEELIATGVIDSGMIPKVEACLDALRAGVGKTHMIDGRIRHSLLLEIYTKGGIGTELSLA
jgi:acetylglutamate kinase